MLDPRAIAVGGAGYGARSLAVLGLWPWQGDLPADAIPVLLGRTHQVNRTRENDEALLLALGML